MASEYVPDGVPFLRSQNIEPFRVRLDDVKYVRPSFHERLKKSALRPGDVAVVRTGYPGVAAVIPPQLADSNCADLVVITPSASELDSHYLAAIFNSTWGKATVAGNLVGVAQQHFNIGSARNLEVALPPLPIQRRIAEILTAYDDLIENCERRIHVLDAMARSLYREWFVNFRFPGHEKAPSNGCAPKQWSYRPVKEIAEVVYGFPFKSDLFSADSHTGMPLVRIRDIPGGMSHTHTSENVDSRYVIHDGDVLVGMDGDFHIAVWSNGPALQNQRVARFRTNRHWATNHFLFALEQPIQTLNKAIVGTTVAHLGDMHIRDIRLLEPPQDILELARGALAPMAAETTNLQKSTRNLRKTHNLLLPRLLSGQLSLKEPE